MKCAINMYCLVDAAWTLEGRGLPTYHKFSYKSRCQNSRVSDGIGGVAAQGNKGSWSVIKAKQNKHFEGLASAARMVNSV